MMRERERDMDTERDRESHPTIDVRYRWTETTIRRGGARTAGQSRGFLVKVRAINTHTQGAP